jgi:hypothetical protein
MFVVPSCLSHHTDFEVMSPVSIHIFLIVCHQHTNIDGTFRVN